jgi:MscS family membrane protein
MNQWSKLMNQIGIDTAKGDGLLILAATVVLSLVCRVVVSKMKQHSTRSRSRWDDAFAKSLGPPLQLLIWVVGLGVALDLIRIPENAGFTGILQSIRDLGVITAITWFLIRLIKSAQENIVAERIRAGKTVDKAAVDAIGKISRLIVGVVAVLVAMQTLGFNLAGVLAVGGVGGIAIGFAAQDLLANFFGGLMIYLDRPFSEGDWIRSPDREIEGTVEDIGWRVTRIRKFDSRPMYIPNSVFTSIALENPSRMTNRRIYETIGIRYDDAGTMERIVQQVSAYLESGEDIDQEQSIMVNFTTFAPSSLDFFVYCFTRTRDWAEFNRIKQGILLSVIRIIEENGAECAFPTTTVHLQGNLPEQTVSGPSGSSLER